MTITLTNISKSFGDVPILRGVDLAVEPGEFLTLVGPSGCGKSTLLRIMAGLEAADEGTVAINGKDAGNVRPAMRDLAMVFQSYALYPHLTVGENMITPLKLRDLNRRERLPFIGPMIARKKHRQLADQVQATAEILKITHLLDRKPGELSGGQRQRVALGRAMVRKPVAFLMDEPLSNLDAALRVHMRAELAELQRSMETTFVYVTHDQVEALTMSTRVAIMMEGRILQIGTPAEVYGAPCSLAVAEFIGSPKINTLAAEAAFDGRVMLHGQPTGLTTTARGPVFVCMRPEHLALTAPDAAKFTGIVAGRENLGSDVHLRVTLAEGQTIVARLSPGTAQRLDNGAVAHFGFDPANLHLFEQNGQRCDAITREAELA